MDKSCCVFGCKNTRKNPDISFFSFPKDQQIRGEWVVRLQLTNGQRWRPENSSRVCSDHFSADCFVRNHRLWSTLTVNRCNRRDLVPGSVPNVFEDGCEKQVSAHMHSCSVGLYTSTTYIYNRTTSPSIPFRPSNFGVRLVARIS